MDKIERAKELFVRLESMSESSTEVAKRNFEIQSRLASIRG